MKLIIAGSRSMDVSAPFITGCVEYYNLYDDYNCLITEVVSGKAPGIDTSGEYWAGIYEVPVKPFPANWKDTSHPNAIIKENNYGKYDALAGHRRNTQMAEYADALLLIWNGKSTGSAHMKLEMERLGKPIYEVIVK